MILKTELRHEKVRQDLDVKKSKNKTTIYCKNKIDLIFDFFLPFKTLNYDALAIAFIAKYQISEGFYRKLENAK